MGPDVAEGVTSIPPNSRMYNTVLLVAQNRWGVAKGLTSIPIESLLLRRFGLESTIIDRYLANHSGRRDTLPFSVIYNFNIEAKILDLPMIEK